MANITLLDGSIGQELVNRSGDAATPFWSTTVMLDKPDLVGEVHADYFSSGATVATTNTYTALRERLKTGGLEDRLIELWDTAINAARDARDANGFGRVAASIGPLFASYRPDICPPAEEAARLYAEVVEALSPRVDFLLIETMSSIEQAEGALRAAKKGSLPVWLSFSVDDFDGTKLRSGEALSETVSLIERHAPEAVLINCSRPEAVSEAIAVISRFGIPFGAYANGFAHISEAFLEDAPTVDVLEQRSDLVPDSYAEFVMRWIDGGATIVGGCCEVGPAHIQEIAKKLIAAGHVIV